MPSSITVEEANLHPGRVPRSEPKVNYIDPLELRAAVEEAHASGKVDADLCMLWLLMAQRIWDKYHYTADREDFAQSVLLHLLETDKAFRADPEKNLFSYFTRAIEWFGWKQRNRECKRILHEETYRDYVCNHPDALALKHLSSNLSPSVQRISRLVAAGKVDDARKLATELGKFPQPLPQEKESIE